MLNDSLQQTKSPSLVVAATACMGLSLCAGIAKLIFTAHWERPVVWLIFAAVCLLLFLMLRGLYRGRRWAFWLIVFSTGLGILLMPMSLRTMAYSFDRFIFIGQALLQFTALLCLLLSPSRRWFFPQ